MSDLPIFLYPGGGQIGTPTSNVTYVYAVADGGGSIDKPLKQGAKTPGGLTVKFGIATPNANGGLTVTYHAAKFQPYEAPSTPKYTESTSHDGRMTTESISWRRPDGQTTTTTITTTRSAYMSPQQIQNQVARGQVYQPGTVSHYFDGTTGKYIGPVSQYDYATGRCTNPEV